MIVEATDNQVLEMAAKAANASAPMEMGFLHHDGAKVFVPEDFQIFGELRREIDLDYVKGRMVKFRGVQDKNGTWLIGNGDPRSDYQSWSRTYPTYESLALAVGAKVLEK